MPIYEIRGPASHLNLSKSQNSDLIDQKRLQTACQEFEAIFIHQMIKAMRKSIPQTGGWMERGREREIFQTLFDEEISKSISKRGGFGIGKGLYLQMQKKIEERNPVEGKTTMPSESILRVEERRDE